MYRRLELVEDAQRGFYLMAELCARYAISRRVGYKWFARYEAKRGGQPGGSAACHHKARPHRMLDEVAARLLACRHAYAGLP
ncbi:MAG: hypothetical protein ACYC0B_09015 [Gemmatimonadaceae bacterium]